MKAYTKNVLSAPVKLPVMIKKGRKEVQAVDANGKPLYKKNPNVVIIKQIKHKPARQGDLMDIKSLIKDAQRKAGLIAQ
jgi:hypothetical protein